MAFESQQIPDTKEQEKKPELPDGIDKKNKEVVERLGFKDSEPIDAESINKGMDAKFNEATLSINEANTGSRKELNELKIAYNSILEGEGDINKKLELCEGLLKGFDAEKAQEDKEGGKRGEENTAQMEKEAKKNATDTLQTHDQKLEKMKEIGMKLKELQKAEKKAAENTQKADKKAGAELALRDMNGVPGWPGNMSNDTLTNMV